MKEKIDSSAGYFFAGLVVGAAISMFFAPKSGEGNPQIPFEKIE
jgi:hypothetical protein